MAIFDVILAYEETLIIATTGTVREQHGQTLALDGVFDVSELLCGHDVAFAQQSLAVELHVCLEARIGEHHENNQPNHEE